MIDDDPALTLLTAAEAADRVHVSIKTIHSWVHRGLLHPMLEMRNRQSLYRELDVLTVELATRRQPRLRRLLDIDRRLHP